MSSRIRKDEDAASSNTSQRPDLRNQSDKNAKSSFDPAS
jgi:hypothetical protein